MWTWTFWRQVAERTVTGAAAGGLSVALVLNVQSSASWAGLGSGVVTGGLVALLASIAGRAGADPATPLITAPPKEDS